MPRKAKSAKSKTRKRLPGVSIVIPAHNEERTISKTLERVKSLDYPGPIEVIVVNDNCTDRTEEIARSYGVKILNNKKNLGLAKGLNRGIKASKHGIVCTLHSDCAPSTKNWMTTMVKALLSDPKSGAVGCYQVIPKAFYKKLGIGSKLMYYYTVDVPKLKGPRPMKRTNNKGDLYKKSVLKKIGYFGSKDFRVAGEDIDISIRIYNSGHKILLAPALLYHYESSHQRGFKNYLKKNLQYSEAKGAVKRKYPDMYKFSEHWKRVLWNEPTKAILYISLFVPYLNWITIPLWLLSIAGYTVKVSKYLEDEEIIQTPFIRILSDLANIIGFIRGYATGKQQF